MHLNIQSPAISFPRLSDLKHAPKRPTNLGYDRASVREWLQDLVESWTRYEKYVATFNFNKRINFSPEIGGSTKGIAEDAIIKFCKRLDKAYFGEKNVRRYNHRLPRIPILESGHETKWHCHMIFALPSLRSKFLSLDDIGSFLEQEWLVSPFSVEKIHVQPFDDGTIKYLTKTRSKDECEITLDCCIIDAFLNS